MLRQLYIFILLAHPATFKYRFGLEMLAIYDEAAKDGSALALLSDGLRSLFRQWAHPYQPPVPAGMAANAGVPCFQLVDDSVPKRHLMTGAAFTAVLFSALMVAVSMGGRSVGAMIHPLLTLPVVENGWPEVSGPWEIPGETAETATSTEVTVTPRYGIRVITRLTRSSALYLLYRFGVLDVNGDATLSGWEMMLAPAMLRTLDRDGDGNLGPGETYVALWVLDRDGDGIISSREIDRSAALLAKLDSDGDSLVTVEELAAAIVGAG